jgi:CheY-like chemotaxis protein
MTLVLVVEDDTSLQVIYEHVLSRIECEYLQAANGNEALQILDQITPQVIFLDMMLPQMNGDVILEYIDANSRLHQTRIVIVSSNKKYQMYANHHNEVYFVLKPIRPAEIRDFVLTAPTP